MSEKDVPYIVHENAMARLERTIEKLWISLLIIFILFVGSNMCWIYYENQFEDVTITNEVDTGNGEAKVTGIGDIGYGESETNNQN